MGIAAGSTHTTPILPVILAGGAGRRLYPISTEARPKPFVPLQDGESLLTKTLQRVTHPMFLPPVIIGRAQDRYALLNHSRAAGVAPSAILLEQNGRNTAAAVALATRWAQQHCALPVALALLPADHLIAPAELWQQTIQEAARAAEQTQRICLLAATPQRADPAYGYLEFGPASAACRWQSVTRFVEKPADPAPYLARHARWNMGQFIGTSDIIRKLFQEFGMEYWNAAGQLVNNAMPHFEFSELAPWSQSLASNPFDRVILERTQNIAISFTGSWHDLGDVNSWQAMTGLDSAFYARQPLRVDRPWGYFEPQDVQNDRVVKHLIIYPGCRLSLQRHQKREERWRVLDGTAHIELNDQVFRLDPGNELTIPCHAWHRLANHHASLLIIEETQSGYCDEADIERDDDDYGRH